MKRTLDLNCDLGEGEPAARTESLMRWITSANIACGGHAGDLKSMERCVLLAQKHDVRAGAHPGMWSRGDFGRGMAQVDPGELELLLLQQVGALERIARAHRVRLHHIKLHGALYHAVEEDSTLARRYLAAVHHWWPGTAIFARAGGRVVQIGRRMRVRVCEEAFADRAYLDNGNLVPRGQKDALLKELPLVKRRVRLIRESGQVETVTGLHLILNPQTICVHSDTPRAALIAREVRRLLS